MYLGCLSSLYSKKNASVACGIKLEELSNQTDAILSCQKLKATLPDIRSMEENNYYQQLIQVCHFHLFLYQDLWVHFDQGK